MMEVIDKAEFEPWMIGILEPLIAKLVDKVEIKRVEPVLIGVDEAAIMVGRSPRFIADGIARGLFVGRKSDGRTLLEVESLRAYCASLPKAAGTPIRRDRAAEGRGIAAARAKQERARKGKASAA
jgi:hypothetical protein